MGIIARKHNPQVVNYNQLKGSGLFPRPEPVCQLTKCQSTSLPIPVSPIPQPVRLKTLVPLVATKQSPEDNKWMLNGITYPNFNSLWVNIPLRSFTILRTNG